jgi:glycolate oxidase
MSDKVAARAIAAMAAKLGGERVRTAPEILTCYAFDATNVRALPLAVAFPHSSEEVRSVVSLCYQAGLHVVPRGAGTGFVGGTVPVEGGVVVSTERLGRIVEIDVSQRVAVVQAGVVNGVLQREAAKHGLMFPPDPSSLEVSTLGGNVAQDAGGPRALKYGVTRDYVLGVEFVTWDGRLVEPVRPGSGWRNWDPLDTLLTGSEGTLGLITRIWLGLACVPEEIVTVLAFFETTVEAAASVSRILDCGVLPAAVEMIDSSTMECIKAFVDVKIPGGAGCSLLVETDGRGGEAKDGMAMVRRALSEAGCIDARVAESQREREDLWKMRRSISPSLARMAPAKINEDVCVPRTRLPALVEEVARLGRKYRLRVPTFGHAGDGNLHVNIMLDRRDKAEVRRAEAMVGELFEATLHLEGTISGEHGIGFSKMDYLPRQLGPEGMEVQSRIKRAFDPAGTVNPGKVIGEWRGGRHGESRQGDR